MSRALRRLIPSMFNRRLLLLATVGAAFAVVLATKLYWLTVVEGGFRRELAELVLTRTSYLKTSRGSIFDCKGRILAADVPCDDLAVDYSVITGDWAYDRAASKAKSANRYEWSQFSAAQREELIAASQPPFDKQIDLLWQTLSQIGGVDPQELAERRAMIVRKVERMAMHVWIDRRTRIERQSGTRVPISDVADPIREQEEAYAILPAVGPRQRVEIERRIDRAEAAAAPDVWSMLSFVDSKQRAYPQETCTVAVSRHNLPGDLQHDDAVEVRVDGVAFHTIGDLRTVQATDLDGARGQPFLRNGVEDLAGYRDGDLKGRRGIERSHEQLLRGTRGRRIIDRTTDKPIPALGVDPVPGRDVTLSLDIQLQARIQALLSHDKRIGLMRRQRWHYRGIPDEVLGEPLNGAAVVMDIATGEVRAAVSVPNVSRAEMRGGYRRTEGDADHAQLWNRPVQMPYPPGSTIKPIVLAAAVTAGKLGYNETIICAGMLDTERPGELRCWIYKTSGGKHGALTGPEAIKHSCNVFFFSLGRRLGGESLVTWFSRFGLGRRLGCGLDEESRGDLPDLDNPPDVALATIMGIGQGPVRWTPIQAAAAYATIARKGRFVRPTFLAGENNSPPPEQDWHIDPHGAEMAMDGLRQAVGEGGTVHQMLLLDRAPIFDIEGVRIMAKSGTADTGKDWTDSRGVVRDIDDSWTICLVQREDSTQPDFVVVVVVEAGGSGAAVAGPIVNQILYEMRMEGYL